MIIAIDGPAGAGKSTVARSLARQLGFRFLDTGAMYRAVALSCIENELDLDDTAAVVNLAEPLDIVVDGTITRIGDRDVTEEIRKPVVAEAASRVAAIAGVREVLVQLQRNIANTGDIVCEGRDQGSVVFPDADFKFFVTASLESRAKRRLMELRKDNPQLTLSQVIEEMKRRDKRDSNREFGALIIPEDALVIKTDNMDIQQVTEHLLQIIEKNSNRK